MSRARNVALLALLTVAATAVLLGGRNAFARWQPAATRSQGSGRVRITSNRVTGLYPGANEELILTLHNANSRHAVVVRRIRVRDIATSKRGCAPSRRNLTIEQYAGPAIVVPAGKARRVTVLLAMPNSVANACQRAVFNLRYSAQTEAGRRRR